MVLPLAQQVLGEADWRTLDAAFAENRDPLTGHLPSHEYEHPAHRAHRAGAGSGSRMGFL